MERARRAGRSLRPSYLPVALGGAEVSAQSPDIAVHPLVIIGSGFASFCLVAHLLETHAVKATDITIIGPHPFGHGAAYSLNNFGAQDCLEINPTKLSVDDEKRLIPFIRDEFIQSIEREKNIIYVNWDKTF